MIRVHLTGEQRQDLRLRARREVGHVSERTHFVLLSDRGYSPPKIVDLLFGYCETIVQGWLKQYLTKGRRAVRRTPQWASSQADAGG